MIDAEGEAVKPDITARRGGPLPKMNNRRLRSMGVVRNRLVAHLLNDAGMSSETASRVRVASRRWRRDCRPLKT